MQRLEVSGAVRPTYGSLVVKRLMSSGAVKKTPSTVLGLIQGATSNLRAFSRYQLSLRRQPFTWGSKHMHCSSILFLSEHRTIQSRNRVIVCNTRSSKRSRVESIQPTSSLISVLITSSKMLRSLSKLHLNYVIRE